MQSIYTQEELLRTHADNMTFFRLHLPDIYKKLKNLNLSNYSLTLDKNGSIDILYKGHSLYHKDAARYCFNEAREFSRHFKENRELISVPPLGQSCYRSPRFFHNHLEKTLRWHNTQNEQASSFIIPEALPLTIIFGIDSGLHIQELVSQRAVHSLVIVDNDYESLLISTYTIKWDQIIPQYKPREGRFFTFCITETDDPEPLFRSTWNHLVKHAPIFPLLSTFYNHRKTNLNQKIIEKIQKENNVFTVSWGFYDDEANQLNNSLHNLNSNTKILPKNIGDSLKHQTSDAMVAIVGAGPSLNKKIAWLKENRDNIFIISAGTALSILKHNKIVPDLHVEIESDYLTFTHLSNTIDKDYQPGSIIGPVQLNPHAFNAFENKIIFFKDSTFIHSLFGQGTRRLEGVTPTCTNAASAIAVELGFKNLLFFGTDYGYRDNDETHAKGSIYYNESAPDSLKKAPLEKRGKLKILSTEGDFITTEPIYNASHNRLERLIEQNTNLAYYNCSDGAAINGTTHIKSLSNLDKLVRKRKTEREEILKNIISMSISSKSINIESRSQYAKEYLHDFTTSLIPLLRAMAPTPTSMLRTTSVACFNMQLQSTKTKDPMYYLVRGTTWHYFSAGLSIAFSRLTSNEEKEQQINHWRIRFIDFLEQWEDHLDWILNKKISLQDDDWTTSSIKFSVKDPFYNPLSEVDFS